MEIAPLFNSSKTLPNTKLLWISRLGYSCSYSYVSETFIPCLIPQYDLSVFCTGIVHDKEHHERIARQFTLPLSKVFVIDKKLTNSNKSEDHEYFNNYFNGIYHLKDIINQVKPSIILSLDDNIALERQWEIIRTTSWDFDFEFIPYMTIDMANMSKIFRSNPVKKMLTMTNFAKEEINKFTSTIQIDILPHIVDPNVFHPLPNKKQLQLKWLGTNSKFVIGAFNANNTRKRWDILLYAFDIFAQTYNDVVLLFKTSHLRPEVKFGITSCGEYDFIKVFSEIRDPSKIIIFAEQYNNTELNELYNCCDLGLTTTSGEGWGLIPCEMALCKVPQLVPNWSSFPEIFSGSQGLIPIKEYTSFVGRKYLNFPEFLQNEFKVIAKSYSWHEPVIVERPEIILTEEIATICISSHGNNPEYPFNANFKLIKHFTKVTDCMEFLKEYSYPHRLQILIGLDIDFLKRETPYLEELYEILPKEQRVNYLVPLEVINKYWDTTKGSVGLVSIGDTIRLLEKFYQSPDLCKEEAEYQYQRIRSICDPNIVSEKLLTYLQKYKIYIINMKHRTDRKKSFIDRNKEFSVIFYDGIVGKNLPDPPPECFSEGSYGCALSHLKLWEKCIELNQPIIICEDDAILHPSIIDETEKFINDDIDFIHFGCNYDSILDVELSSNNRLVSRFSNSVITEMDISEFKKSASDTHFYRLKNSFGMMCYLITPKGAKKLLAVKNIRELQYKQLFIPGLNRSINTYTLDCLLNYYYSKNDECEALSAYMTIPPLAICPNDKTQSDCTTG